MLQGRKVILGVTGSIAAYKAALVTRLLVKSGAQVRVIMTEAAHDFITPVTLSTLSRNPVLTRFIKDETGSWHSHVELGLWADAILIAPCTTNTLARLANGICDNLLAAVYYSARCPVFLAPAFDHDMFLHPATQENLDRLTGYGNHLIQPVYGELASGLVGKGRMAEPEEIVKELAAHFAAGNRLIGKAALVTAGPTYEAIDPVRFIGNHSSGKMGYAIAGALAGEGARVTLVSGPTSLKTDHPNIEVVPVTSTAEMFQACERLFEASDIVVFSAAVSDFRPKHVDQEKIKKSNGHLAIELTPTVDIAEQLGKKKRENQVVVGFALETQEATRNAIEKLDTKNLDLIVLNSLRDPGAGFGYDTNKVTLIDRQHRETEFPLKTKQEVARDIVEAIARLQQIHA